MASRRAAAAVHGKEDSLVLIATLKGYLCTLRANLKQKDSDVDDILQQIDEVSLSAVRLDYQHAARTVP